MDNAKGLSALSYLSIFFAPFLVPIVIFFASKDELIRHHSKRALISHIIPIVLGLILFISFLITAYSADQLVSDFVTYGFIISVIGYIVVSFGILIWNLVQAIKVLR